MKRLLTAAAASLLLMLALVGPVGAVGPGCSDFGAASGKGPGFGPFVASYATQGPGTISGIVQGEHTGAPGFPLLCSRP
jgi:hypothetical protein